MSHWVIAPVLLPWLAGILLLLAGRGRLSWARGVSVASTFAQLGLALALAADVSDGDILVYALGDWPAPFGIVLVADRLAAWMLVIAAFLALFALLHAIRGDDAAGSHFHALFQFQLFGLNGAFLTGDLFNLFVFFEILLIASYGLLLHGGGRRRTRAGLHVVAVNLIGSTLFLFAVGTLYGVLGTLNMADLALKVAAAPPDSAFLVRAAGLLLFAVFALKAALLPFYLWLPAAYAHASAPVAALFAIMTKVGAYSLLRVYSLMFGPDAGAGARLIEAWLLPLALLTLMAGAAGALASGHLRQQVAYLVVASVGSLLAAFGLHTAPGIAAGLYYLPHTTFAAAALFLLADSIARRRGETGDRLDPAPAVAGAGVLGGLFFVAAVAAAGLPPLSGFVGKFLTLRAALAHPWWPWIMAVVLIAGLFGVIALARTGSLLFYRAGSPESAVAPEDPSALAREIAPALGLLALGLGLTVAAGPLFDAARSTADQVLQPQRYIRAVLEPGGRP
ncbi:MAG: monovalent cation/H+ antiporter subunit D [Candidatus Competibacter sp.]|nr:monovalent cation/H+ antiporter subunit D [Candidatus Competibacter sp.]